MKTFKMVSISIVENDEFIDFDVLDGFVINQETKEGTWILELYTNNSAIPYFDRWMEEDLLLEARVVISYPENEPAGFVTRAIRMKAFDDGRVSILLKGKLKRMRMKYAEHLLQELLEEGYEGDALFDAFEQMMLDRPRLHIDKEKYAEQRNE